MREKEQANCLRRVQSEGFTYSKINLGPLLYPVQAVQVNPGAEYLNEKTEPRGGMATVRCVTSIGLHQFNCS